MGIPARVCRLSGIQSDPHAFVKDKQIALLAPVTVPDHGVAPPTEAARALRPVDREVAYSTSGYPCSNSAFATLFRWMSGVPPAMRYPRRRR